MDHLVGLISSDLASQNSAKIIDYVASSLDRIISDWVYAAGTSNNAKYGTYTLAITKAFGITDFPPDVIASFSKSLLDQETKLLYRALTMVRQAQTIPTLSLLKQMAKASPADVFNKFDFTLRVIPKLLAQQPYRSGFLDFYMELIRRSPPATRRELLANRKVFSGWIGKLGVEDTDEFVADTFDLLRDHVLKDVTAFTKTAKMGLFNDWSLKNIQRILSNPRLPEPVIENVSSFVVSLLSDRTYGVRLAGENKLALSFLKIVKPWENTAQMDLVVRLLRLMPELITSYFEGLSVAYPLTPKVSMWWFSYTVLHIRVLNLGFPQIPLDRSPKVEYVSKMLMPVTITKQALQQSLTFMDSELVKFQAAQIVLFSLRRLRRLITEVYEPRNWDFGPLVEDILTNRLPDTHLFTKSVIPPLLRTTYLIIFNEICQLLPQAVSLNIPLEAKQVSGLELIQAQQVLEVQTYTSDQTRWWNPSKGEASLFTQLIKFAIFNPVLEDKCSALLQHLVRPTQIFADIPTLSHPVNALLATLNAAHQSQSSIPQPMWDMIDQAVQRATKSPYQYIDRVKSSRVSALLVALIEQYSEHFAQKDSKEGAVKQWLLSFARSMIVLGEDEQLIRGLTASFDDDRQLRSKKSDDYFDFVLDEADDTIIKRNDIIFKISNKLELAATLYRIVSTESPELRRHLLANIPDDMVTLISENPAAFSPFLSGSRELFNSLVTILDGRVSDALRHAIEESSRWNEALELISSEHLLSVLGKQNETVKGVEVNVAVLSAVVSELNRRAFLIPFDLLLQLIRIPGIAGNLELREPGSMGIEFGEKVLPIVKEDALLLAAVVKVSGLYDSTHPLALNRFVLTAGARYAHAQVGVEQALKTAGHMLNSPGTECDGISIAAEFIDNLKDPVYTSQAETIWKGISQYIEESRHSKSQTVLLDGLVKLSTIDPPFLSRWFKIMAHHLTKKFAENKVDAQTLGFINAMNSEPSTYNKLWHSVNPNAINALIEALLREERSSGVYEMISKIALAESEVRTEGSKLTTRRHLSALFENLKRDQFSLEAVVAVHCLFNRDVASAATLEVEQSLLSNYNGSIEPKDRIILNLLEQIEATRQRSWVNEVSNWDVRPAVSAALREIDDYKEDPLIAMPGSSKTLLVTLDELRIKHTIQAYEVIGPWGLPRTSRDYGELQSALDAYKSKLPESPSSIYDSYFLLNCIVSCDTLLENLEVLLSSGLLSFIICCLLDPRLQETAYRVLVHVRNRLSEANFKDQISARLLVGKILMSRAELAEQGKSLPPHIPGMCGQIALILSRPNHYLYETTCKWLLSSPKIVSYDIPLFKAIFNSQSDLKSRELLWVVNTIKSGAVNQEAVQNMIRSGTIEWCLSQVSLLNTKSEALRTAVAKMIDRIEELRGGSLSLVKESGIVGMPQFKRRAIYAAGAANVARWAA